MKALWIYVHATIATIAWLFILLALAMALADSRSGINQDPVFAAIAMFIGLGHLSAGSYLFHRIREEIRESKRAKRPAQGPDETHRGVQAS